ncbi:hypothetical protein CR513_40604, partial [Mucuna pruriens]
MEALICTHQPVNPLLNGVGENFELGYNRRANLPRPIFGRLEARYRGNMMVEFTIVITPWMSFPFYVSLDLWLSIQAIEADLRTLVGINYLVSIVITIHIQDLGLIIDELFLKMFMERSLSLLLNS